MGCGVHLLEEFRPNSSNCPLNCGEELRRERQETDAIQNRVINDAKRQRWQAWDASLPRLNGIADMKIYVWEWIHLVMVFQVSCNLLYSKIHIYIYIFDIYILQRLLWKNGLEDIFLNFRPDPRRKTIDSTPGIAMRRQSFGAIADCRDCRLKGGDGFAAWLVGDYSCFYRSIVYYTLWICVENRQNIKWQLIWSMIFYCEVLAWINRGNTSTPSSTSKYIRFHTTDSMASSEPSGEQISLVCIGFSFHGIKSIQKNHLKPKGLNILKGCICHGIIDGHIYCRYMINLHGIINWFNICHGIVDVYTWYWWMYTLLK